MYNAEAQCARGYGMMRAMTYTYDRHLAMQVQALEDLTSVAQGDLFAMHQQLFKQQKAILDLTVTVNVLTKMLVESGAVDGDVMRARIDAGIEEMGETSKQVQCISCKQQVPVSRTTITAAGLVCDECTA